MGFALRYYLLNLCVNANFVERDQLSEEREKNSADNIIPLPKKENTPIFKKAGCLMAGEF
ncbi:MAG: hypothetical protein A2804_02930 [Candidatus Pacebacteria bacterium RIFCSPHIGHO2_01_FULL_46_10]|nr:MAG: hypothetical protein A2804_02930 [Candidatus Pacebacteria bacterium RIFCSPHIGHO2_01_FULL_46_10]